MLRRLAAVAAALVATALLPAAQATAGTDPDPMAGAPAVGDCFDFMLSQGYGDSLSEQPVDCADGHTALVTAVGKLPARLDWDSPRAQLDDAMAPACKRGLADLIGYDPLRYHRSQYAYWRFVPTPTQRDNGARWFDCMISIQDARGLADLPDTLPKLTRNLPDIVARCVTRTNAYATCAETHVWRSSYAFYTTGKVTDRNIDRAADRVCPRHVTSPRNWLRSAWDVAGRRFIVACYSKTAR